MSDKLYQDKETLEYLYCEKGYTTDEIAERLGCGRTTVCRWMDRFSIPRNNKFPPGNKYERPPKAELYNAYWGEHQQLSDLAETYEVSKEIVRKWFREYGIPFAQNNNRAAFVFSMRTKDHRYELYWGEQLSLNEIAEQKDVSREFVCAQYQESDVPVRGGSGVWYTDGIPIGWKLPRDEPPSATEGALPDDPDPSKYMAETPLHRDKQRLYQLYWGYGLSLKHIQARCEGSPEVSKSMQELGIPVRNYNDHRRWAPHLGVPPKYEWPDDEFDEQTETASADHNGMTWRVPVEGVSSEGCVSSFGTDSDGSSRTADTDSQATRAASGEGE